MLQYERIGISDRIDPDESDKSNECLICSYWYFLSGNFNFEKYFCNDCHDISMIAYESENIVILNVKDVDYRCLLWGVFEKEAVKLMNNSILDDTGTL